MTTTARHLTPGVHAEIETSYVLGEHGEILTGDAMTDAIVNYEGDPREIVRTGWVGGYVTAARPVNTGSAAAAVRATRGVELIFDATGESFAVAVWEHAPARLV